MKKQKINLIAMSLILSGLSVAPCVAAPFRQGDSRLPRYAPAGAKNLAPAGTMDPKNVPDFAASQKDLSSGQLSGGGSINGSVPGTALRADLSSSTVPVSTRFKLVLESAVDARTSKPGDIFEAHVKDDMYLGTTLLLPRGTLVRGRVANVVKPRLLSRAAKIGLRLEQMVTPAGDVTPLDAMLEFKKGMTNKRGELDPGTSFGTRVEKNVRSVTGINEDGKNNNALLAANIATLGAPAVATALGSSAIALFSQGDNVSLAPGQELELQLTNDLGVQLN
ncbi:TrbI/VirB10 family protein [bacterium]|nr:TrbI/VirB10 family protein [bacterium]QQR56554.1 MAG: TrbI/VirB10 family protein [Candidatus Melainabacteria bacterium]